MTQRIQDPTAQRDVAQSEFDEFPAEYTLQRNSHKALAEEVAQSQIKCAMPPSNFGPSNSC